MAVRFEKDKLNSADKLVKDVYGYLEESFNARERQKFLDRHKKCWDFYENDQWTEEERALLKKGKMPDLVINRTTPSVETKAALVTDSKPLITFTPVGAGDDALGQLYKRGTDKTWDDNRGNDTLYDATIETEVGGLSWLTARLNKNVGLFGKVEIADLDPLSVHIDPLVKRCAVMDGRFILVATEITMEEARKSYDLDDADLVNPATITPGSDTGGPHSVSSPRDDYGSEAGMENSDADGRERRPLVWEIEAWIFDLVQRKYLLSENGARMPVEPKDEKRLKEAGLEGQIITRRSKQVEHAIIVGQKVVERQVNPNGVDSNEEPIMGVIPYPGRKVRGPYPYSDVYYLIDPQREKNKRRAQLSHYMSANSNASIMSPKGAVTRQDLDTLGQVGVNTEYDSKIGKPERLPPGTIGLEVFVAMDQRADKDMDEIMGIPEAVRGIGQSGDSGKKTRALQEFGTLNSKPTIRSLENAMEQLGKLVCALLVQYMPVDFWERLVDREKEPYLMEAVAKIARKDPSLVNFDVKVGAGSSLPSNREAKLEQSAELIKVSPPELKRVMFRHMVRYVDEPGLEEEIEKAEQADAQAQAMQAMESQRKLLNGMQGEGGAPPPAAAGPNMAINQPGAAIPPGA